MLVPNVNMKYGDGKRIARRIYHNKFAIRRKSIPYSMEDYLIVHANNSGHSYVSHSAWEFLWNVAVFDTYEEAVNYIPQVSRSWPEFVFEACPHPLNKPCYRLSRRHS